MQAFMDGDEEALAGLIAEMTPPLMKYSFSILLNYSDAEDAVQTAFFKAFVGRSGLRDPGALSAFLYRITYNASVDIARKRRFVVPRDRRPDDSGYLSETLRA
ncbi:MAG: RNA polymerase sigma factor, partial [Oscillospiraceae bacterium]|nr:RNA polymerase sigma factor [Oscillospiraceae bacterium]